MTVVIDRGDGQLGIFVTADNLVAEVRPDGPCAGIIRPGDRLVGIDGKSLARESVHARIERSPTHKLRIRRENTPRRDSPFAISPTPLFGPAA